MSDEILIKSNELNNNYILVHVKNFFRNIKVKIYLIKLKKIEKKNSINNKTEKYKYIIAINKSLIKLDNANVKVKKKTDLYKKKYKELNNIKNKSDSLFIESQKESLNQLLNEIQNLYNEAIKAKKEYDLIVK